jgi:hypothetical protein
MNRLAAVLPALALLSVVSPDAAAQAAARARPADRAVWPDEGPATWTARRTTADITANDLRTRLYQFADDSMMGRRIGEEGNFKGTEYIAREFQRLGLRPAGDNGTYFQELPYGRIGFDSAAARLIAAGAPLAARTDWIPIVPTAANGFGASADLTDVPVVFGGRMGETTALDPAVYSGKVVVFLAPPPAPGQVVFVPTPPQRLRCDSVPDRFGAAAAILTDAAATRADSLAGRGRFGPRPATAPRDTRAQAAGARAILIVSPDSLSTAARNAAFLQRSGMRPAEMPGAPAASITAAAAARLFGRPVAELAVGAVGQSVTAKWSYAFTPARWPSRNVLAVLPGVDPARSGEYVLVSAHNDHVGVNANPVDHDSLRAVNTVTRRQGANDPVCRPTPEQQRRIDSLIAHARTIRPPRRDSIMNGADDDGSGTVVLLEIAERFVTERPARSILFVSHQGEESGLLGSRWFTDHPTVPLTSIVAAHNMDMVGKGRVEQVKYGGPASVQMLGARRLSREFGDIIDSVNAVRSEPMAIDKSWDVTANPMNRFCRSDQVNYVRHDIPVTYFSLGYSQDYHQATDEPRYVDYEHSARVGRFVHDIMLAIAQRAHRPAIAGPDPAYPRC